MTSRPRVTVPAVPAVLPAAAEGDALLDALCRIARMVAESLDQKCVEIIIGRLARRQMRRSPERWIEELRAAGMQLTAIEAVALAGLDPAACERFARTIDPRLQRASLTQPAAAAHRAPAVLGKRERRRSGAREES